MNSPMEQAILIPIEKIVDNPYQHREQENPADVQEIAISIAQHGLQQYPAVRAVNSHYELIFGHTRTAAYRLLATSGVPTAAIKADKQYAQIPVYVRELTDKQMFELAIVENLKRRDPKPTEKAKAIQKYMDEFKATSKEAGELFSMNDATARGMVRLLDLPIAVQQKLDDGTITQGTARTFLSMQKVASEKDIVETLKQIEKRGGDPDQVIDGIVDRLDNVTELWNDNHRDGKPRAGYHGWLLDMKNFPNKLLPLLTGHIAVQALDCFNDKPAQKLVLEYAEYLSADTAPDGKDKEINQEFHAANKNQMQKRLDALAEINPAYVEKLQHLVNPPACTACPFYTKIRGSHYCGVKLCHARKTEAWMRQQLEQTSKNTGIPLYTEADGRYVLLVSHDDKCSTLFTKRHADLRLVPKSKISGYQYQNFQGVDDDVCFVVATGDAIAKLGNAATKSGGGSKSEKEKAEMRAMKIYRARRKELLWECTAVAKSMFDGVPLDVLERLASWRFIGIDDRIPEEHEPAENAKADVKAEYHRRALIWRLMVGDTSHYRRETMAEILEVLQENTKVKPPKTLIKLAEQWDAEIDAAAKPVAVETKAKK